MSTENKLSFSDIFFSWGLSILVLFALIMSFVGLVNGNVNTVKEFFTTLASYLIYAVAYIIIRLVPQIDERPSFYPKKKL